MRKRRLLIFSSTTSTSRIFKYVDKRSGISAPLINIHSERKWNMNLTSDNVRSVFTQCLAGDSNDYVEIEGIAHSFRLSKSKLEEHKDEIKDMLSHLPKEFFTGTGSGYTFLAACNDANGNQWTGLHLVMESLFVLGIGLGVCRYLHTPRNVDGPPWRSTVYRSKPGWVP